MLWVVCLVLVVAEPIWGEIHGAPSYACNSMMPNHYSEPRWYDAPYQIQVVEMIANEEYLVAISADSELEPFKGFLIEARRGSSTTALGRFDNFAGNAQGVDCNGNANSGATHTRNELKTYVSFSWFPDGEDLVDMRFVATVVQRYDIFWMDIESTPLV